MIREEHIPMLIDVIPDLAPLHRDKDISFLQERKDICGVVADFLQENCDENQLKKTLISLRKENEKINVNNKETVVTSLNVAHVANIVAKFGTKELRERAQKYLRLPKHRWRLFKILMRKYKISVLSYSTKKFLKDYLLGLYP